MSRRCKLPAGDVLANLSIRECTNCDKCGECHYCLKAKNLLRHRFVLLKSNQNNTDTYTNDVLDAVLAHQSGREPPRCMVVGPKNEVLERFPRSKKTLKISPSSDSESEDDPGLEYLQKLVQGFPAPEVTAQQNLPSPKLTVPQQVIDNLYVLGNHRNPPSSNLTNPQQVTFSPEPVTAEPPELITKSNVQENLRKLLWSTLTNPEEVTFTFEPVTTEPLQPVTIEPVCELVDSNSGSQEDNVSAFPCGKCDKIFSSQKDLIIHSVYHTVEEGFECKTCNMTFKYSYELIKHNIQHTGKTTCDICHRFFPSEEAHATHMKLHQPLRCDICDKVFKINYTLNEHMLTHSDEKNYSCEICGKRFKTKSQVGSHKVIHNEIKKNSCFMCDRRFHHAQNLRTHLAKHHGITEAPTYLCEICGKVFTTQPHLESHKVLHNNRRLSCFVCEKRFHYSGNLKRHLRKCHNVLDTSDNENKSH